MTTIRLDKELEEQLSTQAQIEKVSKSMIIKLALLEYLKRHKPVQNAYEIGEDLFGQYASDSSDLSANYKTIIKSKLRAKHSH